MKAVWGVDIIRHTLWPVRPICYPQPLYYRMYSDCKTCLGHLRSLLLKWPTCLIPFLSYLFLTWLSRIDPFDNKKPLMVLLFITGLHHPPPAKVIIGQRPLVFMGERQWINTVICCVFLGQVRHIWNPACWPLDHRCHHLSNDKTILLAA